MDMGIEPIKSPLQFQRKSSGSKESIHNYTHGIVQLLLNHGQTSSYTFKCLLMVKMSRILEKSLN